MQNHSICPSSCYNYSVLLAKAAIKTFIAWAGFIYLCSAILISLEMSCFQGLSEKKLVGQNVNMPPPISALVKALLLATSSSFAIVIFLFQLCWNSTFGLIGFPPTMFD